jgi:hypothetical protein
MHRYVEIMTKDSIRKEDRSIPLFGHDEFEFAYEPSLGRPDLGRMVNLCLGG